MSKEELAKMLVLARGALVAGETKLCRALLTRAIKELKKKPETTPAA